MSSSSPWIDPTSRDPASADPAFPLLRRAGGADEAASAHEESEADRARKPEVGTVEVLVRLTNGEAVLVGRFAEVDEAKDCAESLMENLGNGAGPWPFIGGRFLRPEAIVSIDINASGPKWTGSADRATSWTGRTDPAGS